MLNICTKLEIMDGFYSWLMSKYDWMGDEKLREIITKASKLLDDDLNYYSDAGHRVLFNASKGDL